MVKEELQSIVRPICIFFTVFGLHFEIIENKNPRSLIQLLLCKMWKLLCLLNSFQCCMYTLTQLAYPVFVFSLLNSVKGFRSQMNSVAAFLSHSNAGLTVLICHSILLFKLRNGIKSFIEANKKVSTINPCKLRRLSILGIVGIILSITINCGFSVGWELIHPLHRNKTTSSILLSSRYIEKVTGIALYALLTWSSIALYLIFGQVLHSRYLVISHSVKHLGILDRELYSLHQFFGSLLLTACCSGVIWMITSSYFLVRCILYDRQIFTVIWNSFQIIESFCKLVLICRTSDIFIRLPAKESISTIRRLRDRQNFVSRIRIQRIQMTLYIVEISQRKKRVKTLTSLLGILPLSNRLILQMVQIVVSSLIVLYQFKVLENSE